MRQEDGNINQVINQLFNIKYETNIQCHNCGTISEPTVFNHI